VEKFSVVIVFAVIIGGLSVINLFVSPPQILYSERRLPERMPALNAENLLSGEFMAGFEPAAADAFPFRDGFRAIRAVTVFGAFLQTDKDGVYFDTHGIGSFAQTNPESVALAAEKIAAVAAELDGLNIFYAFIPDKSVFAERTRPGFDAELTENILRERLDPQGLQFISLCGAVDASTFFRTDLHWAQSGLSLVAQELAAAMDIELPPVLNAQWTEAGNFYGVYVGQLALPVRSELMLYFDNPDVRAYYLIAGELQPGPVYDLEMFRGIDPYDIFLRGIQPLVVIENDNAATDRHLYIFRDSFASPLAPLLASAYSRTTLVDFRFIDMRTVRQFAEFAPGSDALFLYSSGILNNAEMLMVNP